MSTATKTRTAKIKRATDQDPNKYRVSPTIDTDTLGPVSIHCACTQLGTEPGKYGQADYVITMYVSDLLTINGRTYDKVRIEVRTAWYEDGDGFGKCWPQYHYGTSMTDSARDAIAAAADPIVRAWIADNGGAERVKWQARNDKRRHAAAYERDEARRHIEAAEKIEATIEPDPFAPTPDPQLDAEVNDLLAKAQGFGNAGDMFRHMIED